MKKVLAANRILVCLLSAILVLSALSAVAFASGGQVTVSVDVTSGVKTYHYGDNITLTYTVNNPAGAEIGNLQFSVDYKGALVEVKGECPSYGSAMINFNEGTGYVFTGISTTKSEKSWLAVTVTAKVKSDIDISKAQEITCTLTSVADRIGDSTISYDSSPVTTTIDVQHKDGIDGQPGGHQWSKTPSRWKDNKEANCTQGGTPYYKCELNGCTKEKEGDYIPAGGHNWDAVEWTWNGDYNSLDGEHTATAKRKCQNEGCEYHDVYENATSVTVEQGNTIDATCLKTGSVTWNATATFEQVEKEVKSTNVGTLAAKDHDWADAQFVWDHENWGGDPDVPPTVTVTRVCNNDPRNEHPEEHVMETPVTVTEVHDSRRDSTCQVTGTVKYTATAKFLKSLPKEFDDGVTSTEEEFVIPLKKHAYTEEVKWGSWTEDSPPTITATRKCDVGGEDVTGEITYSESKSEQSCTKPVTTTYTAYATFTDDTETQHVCPNKNEVKDQITGHSYGDPVFHWDESAKPEGPDYNYTGTVTATLTCANTHTDIDTDGPQSIDVTVKVGTAEGTKPNCVNGGTLTYEGTVDYKDRADGKGTEQDHWADHTEDPKTDTIDFAYGPLGHDWESEREAGEQDRGFKWEPASGPIDVDTVPTVTLTLKCKRPGCDGGYDTSPWVSGNITPTSSDEEPPTCEQPGEITYNASSTPPDSADPDIEPYKGSNTYTVNARGHVFETNAKFTWDKSTPNDYKASATLTCTRGESTCDFPNAQAQLIGDVKVDKVETKKPTYLEGGTNTYTATATFKQTTADSVGKEYTSDPVTEPVDKLTPPTTEPTVNGGGMVSSDETAKSAVQSTVNDAVKAALNSSSRPAGMDDNLYRAIREAGEKSDTMTVTTTLEVKDKGSTASGLTDPNTASELSWTDVTAEQYCGIDIKVQILSGGSVTGMGYINQTGELLSFHFPVSDVTGTGPIILVARNHDGTWEKIKSTVSGDQVNFSSNLFSAFALASSNSIAYADVDPVPAVTYNGQAQTPKPVVTINTKTGPVTLKEGEDYTLSYANNVNVGTADIVITAKSDGALSLIGSLTTHFAINPAPSGGSGSGGATSPNTGDEAPLALYAGMLTLCLAGLAGIAVRRRKNK